MCFFMGGGKRLMIDDEPDRDKFIDRRSRHTPSPLVSGGRLAKLAMGVVSYAPHLLSLLAVYAGASALPSGLAPAIAQAPCSTSGTNSSEIVCVGTVSTAQTFSATGTSNLKVTLNSATIINFQGSGKPIFKLTSEAGLNFTQNASGQNFTTGLGATGIIDAKAGGYVTVSVTGDINLSGPGTAVYVNSTGTTSGDVKVYTQSISAFSFAGSIGVDVRNTKGAITINSSGTISAHGTGVYILSQSDDDIDLSFSNKVQGQQGLDIVTNESSSSNKTIDLNATFGAEHFVGTGGSGIRWRNTGSGVTELVIEHSATLLLGGNKYGLEIENNRGDINVNLTDVPHLSNSGSQSASSAIHVYNAKMDGNTGNVTVSVNAVTGMVHGVHLRNLSKGSLALDAKGSVKGLGSSGDGILAVSEETGALTLSAGNVIGEGGNGIRIVKAAEDSGVITSPTSVSLTSSGTIEGKKSAGILVVGLGLNATVDLNTRSVTGSTYGINVLNLGGNVSISASGTIHGKSYDGVLVRSTGTGNITVEGTQVKSDGGNGIKIEKSATGSITISTTGSVTGSGRGKLGILVTPTSAAVQDISVTTNAVTGSSTGIKVSHPGGGNLTVSASGTVEGNNGDGIDVNNSNSGSLNVYAATVTARAGHGIAATNTTTGSLKISASGPVTGSGTGKHGIFASNKNSSATTLTITSNAVTGSASGIRAELTGTGDLTISATGAILGKGGAGVFATNETSGNIEINVASVTSRSGHGIYSKLSNTGDLEITATGDVRGSAGHGVYAVHTSSGAVSIDISGSVTGSGTNRHGIFAKAAHLAPKSLTITANAVTGSGHGIRVESTGPGSISVSAGGTVLGETATGIFIDKRGDGNVTLNVAAVTSQSGEGINIANPVRGSITVTATGTVTGTGPGKEGILVRNTTALGASLTLDLAAVTGSSDGVKATNQGIGHISVSATGDIVGNAGVGLFVTSSGNGNIDISAATVTGKAGHGILATNQASGFIKVKSTGHVTGTGSGKHGIFARNRNTGAVASYITITANAVTGSSIGIRVQQQGTGAISISASGAVIGKGGVGISAVNNKGSDVTITAASVTAHLGHGIEVQNLSNGTVEVNASDAVEGSGANKHGILVSNVATSKGVTISAEKVTGSASGIFVEDVGTGNLKITATGTVLGKGGTGIHAKSNVSGDITVDTKSVTSQSGHGIFAENLATGSITISSSTSGTVTGFGTNKHGIFVKNSLTGSTVNISAGSVTGSSSGIYVNNRAPQATSVTAAATGTVLGKGGHGIHLKSDGIGAPVTLNVGHVTSNSGHGIYLDKSRSGEVKLYSLGNVTGSGSGYHGIFIKNATASTGQITVRVKKVTGSAGGLVIDNSASGSVIITASDTLQAQSGDALYVKHTNAGNVQVTVDSVTSQAGHGVNIVHQAIGSVIVNLSNVTTGSGAGKHGIRVSTSAKAKNITIDTRQVTGSAIGILATQLGNARIHISARQHVQGGTGQGIYARNTGTGEIRISAVSISSVSNHGLQVRNSTSGSTYIDVTGKVTGGTGSQIHGIYVLNEAAANRYLTITAATVSSSGTAIRAINTGSDNLTILATGTLTSTKSKGIYAKNLNGGNVSVTVSAVTSVFGDGVYITNQGNGSISLSASGDITGARDGGHGIYAKQMSDGTSVTITGRAVTGSETGITVSSAGSGAIRVETSGNIVGKADAGIKVDSTGSGKVTISTSGFVRTDSGHGIFVKKSDTGNILISATKRITGSGTGGDGVRVVVSERATGTGGGTGTIGLAETAITASSSAEALVEINVSSIIGSGAGINISSNRTGNITISATGTVEGASGAGILVYTKSGGELTFTTKKVKGKTNAHGIHVTNSSTGMSSILITATDDVTGEGAGKHGIYVVNQNITAPVTITASMVTGSADGIYIKNIGGTGAISVKTSGAVLGKSSHGIYVNTGSSGVVTISAERNVSGTHASQDTPFRDGIRVRRTGGGTVNINVSAIVHAAGGDGIHLLNVGTGNLVANVNLSSGSKVTASHIVTGSSAVSSANVILAYDSGLGDLTLNISSAGSFDGSGGITAINSGGGSVTVDTTSGTISVSAGGLSAINWSGTTAATNGDSLTVSTAALRGDKYGISADNRGSGLLSISVTGAIVGQQGKGIYARSRGAGNVEVNVASGGSVLGGKGHGLEVFNQSGGSVQIDAKGNVQGVGRDQGGLGYTGISVRHTASRSPITVSANSVTGSGWGIKVLNLGVGDTKVDTKGDVLGKGFDGIYVDHRGTTGRVMISAAGKVTSNSGHGIVVKENASTADVSITASMVVTGTGSGKHGIFVENTSSTGGTITIEANAVTGAESGIRAESRGITNFSITTSASVLGQGGNAIHVHSPSRATITISTTGFVTSNSGHGISAVKVSQGTIDINASVGVTGSGSGKHGIYVKSSDESTLNDITITTNAVTGSASGIHVEDSGRNSIEIDTRGDVTGKASRGISVETLFSDISISTAGAVNASDSSGGVGIYAKTGAGDIVLNISGAISGGTGSDGIAIDTHIGESPNSTKSVSATIQGGNVTAASGVAIRNNGGASNFIIKTGTEIIGAVQLGGGRDVITMSGGTFSSSSRVDGGTGSDELIFASGNQSLTGSNFVNWEKVTVQSGVILSFLNTQTLTTSELVLSGTISLQDDSVNDSFSLTGNLTGGGSIGLDIDFSTGSADVITVTGNVAGSTTINIETVTVQGSPRVERIKIIDVTGTATSTSFVLPFDRYNAFHYAYSLEYDSTKKSFELVRGEQLSVGCFENTTHLGVYDCFGDITEAYSFEKTGSTNIFVILDDEASMTVSGSSTAFVIEGQAGVEFRQQASTNEIKSTGTATNVIYAKTTGNGAVKITTVGKVTHQGSGTTIHAESTGTGTVDVIVGTISASSSATGIRAEGSGARVTVSSNDVTAGAGGIEAKNTGNTGLVSISASGAVSAASGTAIYAYTRGTTLTINARAVTGSNGIIAFNSGVGLTSVNVSGSVTSQSGSGIEVMATGIGGVELSTASNTVITGGSGEGVYIRNSRAGTAKVNILGEVIGIGLNNLQESYAGIQFLNSGESATLTANKVTGSGQGILVSHESSGEFKLYTMSAVLGKGGDGIKVTSAKSGNVSVFASGTVTSQSGHGIDIDSTTSAAKTITVNASKLVTGFGADKHGIYILNEKSVGASIVVSAEAVTGSASGIWVQSDVSGNFDVYASGTVLGKGGDAIHVYGRSLSDIDVTTTGVVTSQSGHGIWTSRISKGSISIRSSDAVTGTGSGKHGISVNNAETSDENPITIIANAVTGDSTGIYVKDAGDSTVSVTTDGIVTGKGGFGIWVTSRNSEISISTSGAVVASETSSGVGIFADTGSDVELDISGAVTGGSAASAIAIDTVARTGKVTASIQGGNVTAAGGVAIRNDVANSDFTIKTGTQIVGAVKMGGGIDIFSMSGGTLHSSTSLDGGAGRDELRFVSGDHALTASNIVNWEKITVQSGAEVSFLGTQTLTTGELGLSGTLSLKDDASDDAVTVTGNVVGGGSVALDVNFVQGSTDTLSVSGNVTGITTLNISPISQRGRSFTERINVVQVSGTSSSGAFALPGGTVNVNRYAYTLQHDVSTKTFYLFRGDPVVAGCFEDGVTDGLYTCYGDITSAVSISKTGDTDITVVFRSSASINVTSSNTSLVFRGGDGIEFRQEENGKDLIGRRLTTGVIDAKTTGDGNIKVKTDGKVDHRGSGTSILAESTGTGNVVVDIKTVSSSVSATAVKAYGKGAQVTVSATAVSAGVAGIVAKNTGAGLTSVSTSDEVNVSNGTGIYAYTKGTNLTIVAEGVSGGEHGVSAVNKGTGTTSITTSEGVSGTGTGKAGVYAYTKGLGLTINTRAVAGQTGISTKHSGTANTIITVSGNVTGSASHGIHAESSGSGNIQVGITSTATVMGNSGHGIYVNNQNTGTLSINATGTIIGAGSGSHGILAKNSVASGTAITITANAVTGSASGIRAENAGSGNLEIIASGAVLGKSATGIYAKSTGSGNVSVSTSNTVSSQSGHGIYVSNTSTGTITVNASEKVTSSSSGTHGIYVRNAGAGGSISLTTGPVTGSASGVVVRTSASGEHVITIAGLVYGRAGPGLYIDENNSTATNTINVSSAISGSGAGNAGIRVKRTGGGTVNLNVSATVQAGSGHGLHITNASAGNLTVSITTNDAGDIKGFGAENHAIYVSDSGTGNLSLTVSSAGDENRAGIRGHGIYATNSGGGSVLVDTKDQKFVLTNGKDGIHVINRSGTSLTIETQGVTGKSRGIRAHNLGTGILSISSTGTITGESSTGIDARMEGTGNILIVTQSVTAQGKGIQAENTGVGNISISASGEITTSGTGHEGILVKSTNSGDISVTASKVVANFGHGIHAYNSSTGSISISTDGDVIGSGGAYSGIFARNTAHGGTGIEITASAVTGSASGIRAENAGVGKIMITATGSVLAKGIGSDGIIATSTNSGDISIVAASVTANAGHGIKADNSSTGSISISATGTVTGSGANKHGITASNTSVSGSTLTITANNVTGSGRGVNASVAGGGKITIDVGGTVLGETNDGIHVYRNVSGDVSVSAATVTSRSGHGINILSNVTGDVEVSATGVVTGSGGQTHGIVVSKHGATNVGSVTITANSVTGSSSGIFVDTNTSGNITLSASGTVTGVSGAGIFAKSQGQGNVSINAKDVTSNSGDGIYAGNTQTGTIEIDATGTVTGSGTGKHGIHAKNAAQGTTLTVSAKTVTGSATGIRLENAGTGKSEVNTTGIVTGKGSAGIIVLNTGAGDIEITTSGAVTASGSTNGVGIKAQADGAGDITLDVSGAVTGGSGNLAVGIDTLTNSGSATVSIQGGNVTASNGIAIRNDEGDSQFTIKTGTEISGRVQLGAGKDVFILSGGTLNSGARLDGGSDPSDDAGGLSEGGAIANESEDELQFASGTHGITGSNLTNWEKMTVQSNATFSALGGQTISVNTFTLLGTLSLQDNEANDVISVAGNFFGGGTLKIDVDFSSTGAADKLTITGNASGTTTLQVATVTAQERSGAESITVVEVGGTVSANAFTLSGTNYESSPWSYSLQFDSVNKRFNLVRGSSIVAGCFESSTTPGLYNCYGDITSAFSASKTGSTNIKVIFNKSATMSVSSSSTAFLLSGQAGVEFLQEASGGVLKSTGSATHVIDAETTGNGIVKVTTTGQVSLADSGTAIEAESRGTGNVYVYANNVSATSSGQGIRATGKGAKVVVHATTVSSEKDGVVGSNTGNGTLTISSSGTVTSTSGTAIHGNVATGTLTISAKNLSGQTAITAKSNNSGSISIYISGTVTATTQTGISAVTEKGGNLEIEITSDGAVTAQSDHAISARNQSAGSITIESSGTITGRGTNKHGIFATNLAPGSAVTIEASTVTGSASAIRVENAGSGDSKVTTDGTITSQSEGAIYVVNSGNGEIVISTSGAVTASASVTRAGIRAEADGSGGISISTVGTVSGGLSGSGTGIRTRARRGDIVIRTSGSVAGGSGGTGIRALARGSGDIKLYISGNVTAGGNGTGINTLLSNGSATITIQDGNIHVGSGTAIRNDETRSKVTLQTGASISGAISLGAGLDELILSGGTLSTTTVVDGGTDTSGRQSVDLFRIDSGTHTLTADNITNWETIRIQSGATVAFYGEDELGVDSLDIDGTLSLSDNSVDDKFTLSGDLDGGGVISLDVDFSAGTADLFHVLGNISGVTTIRVSTVSTQGTARQERIKVASAKETVPESVFVIANDVFNARTYAYTLEYNTSDKSFELVRGAEIGGCFESSVTAGHYECIGTITEAYSISKTGSTNILVDFDASATSTVSSASTPFVIRGSARVEFKQAASGDEIKSTGVATGVIDARTTGNGLLKITTTGKVTHEGSGTTIRAESTGTGNVEVIAGTISASTSATGIKAYGKGAQVSVNATTISAGTGGISAKNTGTGSVSVTTSDAISTSSGSGIYAYSKGSTLTVNTKAVSGQTELQQNTPVQEIR